MPEVSSWASVAMLALGSTGLKEVCVARRETPAWLCHAQFAGKVVDRLFRLAQRRDRDKLGLGASRER